MSNKTKEYLTIAAVALGLPIISSIGGFIPLIGGLIQFICLILKYILIILGARLVYQNHGVVRTKAILLYEKAKTFFA